MSAVAALSPLHEWAGMPDFPRDLLHGVVLHPAAMSWNGHCYAGSEVAQVPAHEVSRMPGVVAVVQQQSFVGVVAMTPVHASQAAEHLGGQWLGACESKNALAGKRAQDSFTGESVYTWRMASSTVKDKAIAWVLNEHASIWIPSVTPDFLRLLRSEMGALLALPQEAIEIFTAASTAKTATDLSLLDAVADAAMLSRHVQRPVVVESQQHSADESVLKVRAAPVAQSRDGSLNFESATPWAVRPSRARLLAHPGLVEAVSHASVQDAGDVSDLGGCRGLQLASVQELNAAQVFVHESTRAEQALQKGLNPIAARLAQMPDGRGRDLASAVVEQALQSQAQQSDGFLSGRGFASAQMQCLDETGKAQTVWSAWVADVAVNVNTGEIAVTRVVAGHDVQSLTPAQQAGMQVISSQNQPHILEGAQRLLQSAASQDEWGTESLAASAASVPSVIRAQSAGSEVLGPQEGRWVAEGQLADQGVITLPAAAAIANAVQQATGVRLRNVPLDPQELRLALGLDIQPKQINSPGRWGWLGAGAAAVVGLAAMAWPAKQALPLTDGPELGLYSAQAIERGRLVAAAGDCVVCHTAPGGKENAGGLGLPTPFGTIYTTNITPDHETGIGRWSFAAFERAMRHGVHQDGRQLYPAFPYTAFAKMNEGDMQALYGYLMSQPAVKAQVPKTELAFPYNMRSSLAGWNVLFHDAKPYEADRSKSVEWNRGAYLVDGAGHCAACHSPRNALGAEKMGVANYLAGGEAEGWTAPALNQLASGPRKWSQDDLVRYMRTGYSANHGVAAGPMAPVIHGLAQLPESDVSAIATYLLDLPGQPGLAKASEAAVPVAPLAATAPIKDLRLNQGERIYQSACAVCHEAGSGPTLFGVKPDLSRNTSLHASTPQNLIQVILNGIELPANDALGHMPAFKDSFDNQQVADLLGYLRGRFAPEEKAWPEDTTLIEQLRMQSH